MPPRVMEGKELMGTAERTEKQGAYGWWTREAGMLKTVSLTCGCGEILTRDGVEPIEVAREGRDLGWRVIEGHWLCPGCASVAGDAG